MLNVYSISMNSMSTNRISFILARNVCFSIGTWIKQQKFQNQNFLFLKKTVKHKICTYELMILKVI